MLEKIKKAKSLYLKKNPNLKDYVAKISAESLYKVYNHLSEEEKKSLKELDDDYFINYLINILNTEKQSIFKEKENKKSNTIYVDIAFFKYIGKSYYIHKDNKGNAYKFSPGDIIAINNDETAYYFDYKSAIFERIK